MVQFTPEFAGNTIIFMIIGYVLALAFQMYMLFLNWKQSKVKDTTNKMLELLISIDISLKYLLKEFNKKR